MIGEALHKSLKKSGYAADWLQNGLDVEPAVATGGYSLVILDLGIPGKDGIEVLSSLRARKAELSILILTARDSIADRVKGLDGGADDYLVKPFALEELEARIRLLLRRRSGQKTNTLTVGGISLDLAANEVSFQGQSHSLSAKELTILRILMEQPSYIFSRAKLEEQLYGWNEEVESNSIEVHIYQLRKKLGKKVIVNIRNVGYRLGETK